MRAAIGYERDTMHLPYERGFVAKPVLKVSIDLHNNVGRLCRPTGCVRREWRVMTPMRDQWFNRYYLLAHMDTNVTRIVHDSDMHDLY